MNYAERHILETLIYLPMLTAVVLLAVPQGQRTATRGIGIASGALLLLGSAYVFVAFDYGAGAATFQLLRTYPWLEQVGIDFRLGIDGVAAPMVLLTGIVSLTASIIAANVEREFERLDAQL